MNKVIIEIETPDSVWSRGTCQVKDDGTMHYEARFLRSGSHKAQHMGPVVTVLVKNPQGKEISRRSATIGVRSNGDLFFHYYKEAVSELEKEVVPPTAVSMSPASAKK